jgi:hypothetical protein
LQVPPVPPEVALLPPAPAPLVLKRSPPTPPCADCVDWPVQVLEGDPPAPAEDPVAVKPLIPVPSLPQPIPAAQSSAARESVLLFDRDSHGMEASSK